MRTLVKPLALAALAAGLAFAAAPQAEAARVGIGIGIGVPIGGYYGPGYYGPGYWGPGYWSPDYYYGPRYVYAPPPRVVAVPPAQALPQAADPIFYPKTGQTPRRPRPTGRNAIAGRQGSRTRSPTPVSSSAPPTPAWKAGLHGQVGGGRSADRSLARRRPTPLRGLMPR